MTVSLHGHEKSWYTFSKNKLTYNAIFQKHWSVFKYNVYFKHGFRYLKWQQNIENERLKAKALKKNFNENFTEEDKLKMIFYYTHMYYNSTLHIMKVVQCNNTHSKKSEWM